MSTISTGSVTKHIALAERLLVPCLLATIATNALNAAFYFVLYLSPNESTTVLSAMSYVGNAAYLVTAAVFLAWFGQTAKRAAEVSPQTLELTPRWAVVSWFVPFLNFVFPYQMTKAIWKALMHGQGRDDDPPEFFLGWWVLFLSHGILGRVAVVLATPGDPGFAWLLAAVAHGLGILAAVQCIRVVQLTTALALRPALVRPGT